MLNWDSDPANVVSSAFMQMFEFAELVSELGQFAELVLAWFSTGMGPAPPSVV